MSVTTISTHFTKRNAKDDVIATLCSEVRFGVRWINNLWIEGESRGEGYATELLQQCIEEFYGQDLYLMVRAYNDQPLGDEELVEFYAQFGFEEIEGAPSLMVRPGDKPKQTKAKPKKKKKPAPPVRNAPAHPNTKRFRGQADEEDPEEDDWEDEEAETKPLRRTARPAKEKLPPGHRPPFHIEGVGAFDESKPEDNEGVVAKPENKRRRR